LPNVLGKQEAAEAGAFETWLVDGNGCVTEGTSTNAWIVTPDNRLVTRNLSNAILSGITRRALLERMRAEGFAFEERRFTVAEAKAAPEAFLTSTTSLVLPVTSIDSDAVGDGRPGRVTMRLRDIYTSHVSAQSA
jgi:D-alanine transaminase